MPKIGTTIDLGSVVIDASTGWFTKAWAKALFFSVLQYRGLFKRDFFRGFAIATKWANRGGACKRHDPLPNIPLCYFSKYASPCSAGLYE